MAELQKADAGGGTRGEARGGKVAQAPRGRHRPTRGTVAVDQAHVRGQDWRIRGRAGARPESRRGTPPEAGGQGSRGSRSGGGGGARTRGPARGDARRSAGVDDGGGRGG